MLRLALTTAFAVVSLSIALPGAALANMEDDFRARCLSEGGSYSNGTCTYPDGRTVMCAFGEDDWGCYSSGPRGKDDGEGKPEILKKNFGKFERQSKKPFKTPIPRSQVMETEREVPRTVDPSPVTMHKSVAPKASFSESLTMAPALKMKSFR